MQNVRIQEIGNHGFTELSEGNGRRTASYGIFAHTCSDVSVKGTYIFSNFSELCATGIKLLYPRNVHLADIDCIYQRSAYCSCGVDTVDLESLQNSESEKMFIRERTIAFDRVRCELNLSRETSTTPDATEESFGVRVRGVFSVQADELICRGVNGHKVSYGFYGDGIVHSDFKNSLFNQSKSNRYLNDRTSDYGIAAFGFYGKNVDSLHFENCKFSNNFAKNTGIGGFFDAVKGLTFETCYFNSNRGLAYKKDEVAGNEVSGSIRNLQEQEKISKHAPVVSAAQTGGYGCCIQNCQRVTVEKCEMKNNLGHRAIGCSLKDSSIVKFDHSSTYYQYATGNFLHDEIATQENVFQLDSSNLVSNLVSSLNISNKSDFLKIIKEDLESLQDLRGNWLSEKNSSLNDQKTIIRSLGIITSLLTKYRLWGVAYGIHFHNCTGILIQSSQFGGQISEQDNAAGLVLSGSCSDFYLDNSELSYNYGWRLSARQEADTSKLYDYYYDFSAVKSAWDALNVSFDLSDTVQSAGFYKEGSLFIARGQKELDNSGHDIGIKIDNKRHTFTNVIAPLTSGLIFSDHSYDGTISNNKFHGNKGGAGYCSGLTLDASENFLIKENLIADNGSNIYGYCCGILDVNLYSENSYTKNELSFNRVDGYYNSHALIIADSRSNVSDVYPKVELNTGPFKPRMTELHNIEIMFPMSATLDKKMLKIKD